MADLPYHTLTAPESKVSAGTMLARVADAAGFRLRWATEGLRPEDETFSPGGGCMTTFEILNHICQLLVWTERELGGDPKPADHETFAALREDTLCRIDALARHLESMDAKQIARIRLHHGDQTLPVWNFIHGPLVDMLTHVGQISSWRRLSGNPSPKARLLFGLPPKS